MDYLVWTAKIPSQIGIVHTGECKVNLTVAEAASIAVTWSMQFHISSQGTLEDTFVIPVLSDVILILSSSVKEKNIVCKLRHGLNNLVYQFYVF